MCKQMQQRVVELIPNLSEDEMIGELLLINDDLNNAFIRYERCSDAPVKRESNPVSRSTVTLPLFLSLSLVEGLTG